MSYNVWFGNSLLSKTYLGGNALLMTLVSQGTVQMTDALTNLSFRWSEILRVQLKSNQTVAERLLACDQEWVC